MKKSNLKLLGKVGQPLLLSLILIAAFAYTNNSRADSAPERPECTSTTSAVKDKNGNWQNITIKPTCGSLEFSASFNLGQYKDKFVVVETTGIRYGGEENKIASGSMDLSYSYAEGKRFVAIDKEYFNQKNGLDGIFKYGIEPNGEFGDQQTIETKNKEDLSKHSYTFVVSRDDELATALRPYDISGDKYFDVYTINNPYIKTSNLKCGTDIKCTEDVVYVPQSISDHYIILTKGKVIYNPSTIGQSITYPIYNQQEETEAPKSIWQRILNWFKSFSFR